jgi:hypothetical protein
MFGATLLAVTGMLFGCRQTARGGLPKQVLVCKFAPQ